MALDATTGLPGGMSPFLRGAHPVRQGDTVRVAVQDAVLERLADDHRQALEASLATILGESVRLHVTADGEGKGTGERISQEKVKEGRLRELIREEPALEHAVRELDLELLD